MLHQHPECLCSLRPNIGAGGITDTFHKRPLQLREERFHKHRDPLEHRRQRAENGDLDTWRIRHRLSRNTNQRSSKRNHEGFDRIFARALYEVANGVRCLFPLVVASSGKAGDDDGYRWRDTFWEVEARNSAPRRTRGVDGPAKRDDQWLQFVLWN